MKLKGINFFEQHVEKIVLGTVALIAAGFTARQLITNPNAVEVRGQNFAPARVDEELANRAEELKQRLDSTRSIDYRDTGSLSDWFAQEQSRNLSGAPVLPAALVRATPLQIGDSAAISGEVGQYAEFTPPAPTNVQVFARPYSLDPTVLTEQPEIESVLPDQPPYDLPVVHVFAHVNGKAIRESLLAPVKDRSNIPSAWWDRDLMMLDVVVERQKRLPDGSWSETEVVEPIPGQRNVRGKLDSASASQTNEILYEVDGFGPDLYQPKFYTLAGNEEWTKKQIEDLKPKSPEMIEAINQLKRSWGTYLDQQKRLERMIEAGQRERNTEQRSNEPPGGLGEGGGKGSGGQQTSEDTGSARERNLQKREQMVEDARLQYEDAKNKVLVLDPDFSDFPDEEPIQREDDRGTGRDAGPADEFGSPEPTFGLGGEGIGVKGGGREYENPRSSRGGPDSRSGRAGRSDTLSLLEDENREVWVHDIDVEPNAEYRYRTQVAYFNPFFGRSERLSDEQKPFAESIATLSPPTEWSDPIRVVSTKQFFVVDGTYHETVEGRKASVEVYVFSGGREHMTAMAVRVGEPIGDTRTVSLMTTPGAIEPEPARGDPRRPVSGDPAPPAPTTMDIDFSTGAVLLDVIEAGPGSGLNDRKVQVLVALEDGTILAIDPETHRRSESRTRLQEMASK